MELINNLKRGYKDMVKWAKTPEGIKALKLAFIFALSITLFFGIGYLFGRGENPAPIVINQN